MQTALLRLSVFALLFAHAAFAAELVSVGPGLGASAEPTISGDGRFIAFSSSSKFSIEDTNALVDVYLRDCQTGTTRLISDNRGGDQPIISANGRFIVFRALETFPKLRVVDLETQEPPRTVSFPQDTGFSFRFADTAAITPEGRFIAFPFRTIPGVANGAAVDLYVTDTTVADRTSDAAAESITQNFPVDTLGRSAISRDGNTFFTETSDRVLPNNDTNDVQDIYKLTRGSNAVVRLSAVTDGLLLDNGEESRTERLKPARDPALTADGSACFFITARRLRTQDTDGRATIYRSEAGTNFQIPVPIATPGVTPISMSRQAVGDGQYLVFLGHTSAGFAKYILRLSDGALKALSPSISTQGNPVISADNSRIAFSTSSNLGAADGDGRGDIYVVPNPFNATPLPPPSVTLNGTAAGVKTSPFTATLSASSASSAGIVFTRLELDGQQIANSNTATLSSTNFNIPRGVHTVRAVALDRNNLTTYSTPIVYDVRVSNSVLLSPPAHITRSGQAAGKEIAFSGTVRVDNTTASAKANLQIVLTQAPNDARWEFFGNDVDAAVRDVQILGVIKVPSVPANATAEVAISGLTLPPEVLGGQHFRGVGWTINAKLQDVISATTATQLDTLQLFLIRPRLDEGTPGPNGGTPVLGSEGSDGNFTPATVNSITINPGAPTAVAERTRRAFTATASFTQAGATSTRPITPQWSVITGGAPVSISPNGVLTAGDVAAPRTVTLRAAFGGKTNTLQVTVKPLAPVVSVRAGTPLVLETAQSFFRILRTPISNQPLDVSYSVSGLASNPNRFGDDFTPLTGAATILAGKSFVDVPLVPLADSNLGAEGNESVILTVTPSGDYRLGAVRSATMVIDDADDDPLPPTVPDATIRRGTGAVVGAKVYAFGDVSVAQVLAARARVGVPIDFVIGIVNRSNASETLTIQNAGADFNGFVVRYLQGTRDVTADVLAGTVQLNDNANVFAPGEGAQLKLRITATAAVPHGASYPCNVSVRAQGGSTDIVQALVTRSN